MDFKNSKGQVFYGMHFYPGVAQYQENGNESYRVFINEDTIRQMSPSFTGRPIFVEHVEEVDSELDEVKKEADGWVVESFFNAADGKTWAKFIVVSERGLNAIRRGMRLSNAYAAKLDKRPGVWNGVDYVSSVTGGEFEHLAIVDNPRYDESVIMSPDEFKKYNDDLNLELKRLSNSKGKKEKETMKFNIFKRTKVENQIDPTDEVEIPEIKKTIGIGTLVNSYVKVHNMNGYANGDHMVKVGDKDEFSVNDLVKKHMEACNELADMKAKNVSSKDGGEPGADDADAVDPAVDNSEEQLDEVEAEVGDRGGDESLDNEDDADAEKKKKDDEKVKNKLINDKKIADAKKVLAKDAATRLKNANQNSFEEETARVDLPQDKVNRGKQLYGSK